MRTAPTFFWYDLETFGLDPCYDKIAQFAGQRTDMDLNPVGDPVVLYCKPPMDYLPDPLSCLVTGITPQTALKNGLPEYEFIEQINDIFSVPNTTVCGFNSLRFDDEFIRNALYRNFLDPYRREWANGNSRWDILDLVRAAHDLRPEGFNWPPKNPETGNPVFKLTELTAANSIDQTGAHDAMVDVRATIAVAKLIRQKAPRLFDYFYRLRSKAEVKNLIGNPFATPCLLTCAAFTRPEGCTSMIVPLTPSYNSGSTIICFDLRQDIDALISASSAEILSVPGIIRVSITKCPALSPLSVLTPETAVRLGINRAACLSRWEKLKQHPELVSKIHECEKTAVFNEVDDTDFQLYKDFFPDSDRVNFDLLRRLPPAEKLTLNLRFTDTRCQQMLWRMVCRSYPGSLDPDNRRKYMSFCANRLLCPPGDVQNNLQFFERKIAEKLGSTDTPARSKQILMDLRTYGEYLKKIVFGK